MTPSQAIADLDKMLFDDGQDIVLRRVRGTGVSPTNVDVTCRAFVRGFAPNELVGGFTQQDRKVIISSTEIDTADWPADEPDSTSNIDHRVPRKNRKDVCVFGGRTYAVESSEPIYMAGTLVRINMVVRGLA